MIGDQTLLHRRQFLGSLPLWGLAAASSAWAESIEFDGATFSVYRLDPKTEELQLFLLTQDAQRSPTFEQLERDLNARGNRLKVAMNAGIYEPGFRPSGLHISEGKTIIALNTAGPPPKASPTDSTPNFYLLPNGVFFIRQDGTASVLATQIFATSGETPRLATQSGPLLLAGGTMHPAFREGSPNRLLRNGIGVDSKGRVVLVSSVRPPGQGRINFFSFATLFRDKLDCQDALYLDGDISNLYIRGETGLVPPRTNFFAGVLAVVEPAR
jgi:uncharacterized protein YigE (DUF2233 family)